MSFSNYRIGISVTLLALLFVTVAEAQKPVAKVNSLSSVPANAAALIHVDLEKMMRAPGMTIPLEIFTGVKQEADDLFEQHLGIRISELQTITFVAPSFNSVMALQTNSDQTGFGIFSFAKPVDKDFVEDHLPTTWRPQKIGEDIIYVDSDTKFALFHSEANTIVFGSEQGIGWFLENRDNRSDGTWLPAKKMAESGHVTIAINGNEIPPEMKGFVPSELKFLATAELAAINLDFSKGIAAQTLVVFNTKQDAASAEAFAKQNIKVARTWLQEEEANAQVQLITESDELFAAMEPLSKLAFIRYGDKILQRVSIKHTDNQLQANLSIEGFDGQMLMLTCLSAVQAIGTASEAEFQSIADELNSAELKDGQLNGTEEPQYFEK